MISDFNERLAQIRSWAVQACEKDWLDSTYIRKLEHIETESAGDLFKDQERRPLLVGFFGGTGVGKSSLLNRLAGQPIARVGVTRPTSTQVTMYVHRSQTLNALPEGSPIQDTHIEYHDLDNRQDVAWLDMPDIDSVEADHRRLVMAWLPYVDWLIYVVSPERYRDDMGWQTIESRYRKHHWLFVINRWDEAIDVQLNEFEMDLKSAGFPDPVVLRTSCVSHDDDFDQLETMVNKAIHSHGLAELQRIGVVARLEELNAVSASMLRHIGSEEEWAALRGDLSESVNSSMLVIKDRVLGELESVVNKYPAVPAIWRSDPDPPQVPEADLQKIVISEYNAALFKDVGSEIVIAAEQAGLPTGPLHNAMEGVLVGGSHEIFIQSRDALKEAMVRPGTPVQRTLRKFVNFAAFALPILTSVWVAYRLVIGYQGGLEGEQGFFGINFAVHSLLLIGLAWLIPFLLLRWLRPSLRGTARRGLRLGLDRAIASVKSRLDGAVSALTKERETLRSEFPGQ